MTTITKYVCDICGEVFDNEIECQRHEILEKIGNQWKIKQYVLSMTIPNDVTQEVINAKSSIEDSLLQKLKQ